MPTILLPLFLAARLLAVAEPDPYASPPPRNTPERLAFDAMRGGPRQDAMITRWLAKHPRAPLPVRAMLAHRICLDYGRHVHGTRWFAACKLSVALNPGLDDDDLIVATIFRDRPPLTVSGSARVPLIDKTVGSRSTDITVNGVTLPWIVDTGAGISLVSESSAKRLGVRRLGGTVNAETATSIKPEAAIGMIDRLTFGDAVVENMPIAIFPDAVMRSTNGYIMPAVLGLPAMVAFNKLAIDKHGTELVLGSAVDDATDASVPVYWSDDGIGLPLVALAGTIGMTFDLGAYATHLRTPVERVLTSQQLAGLTTNPGLLSGLGGTEKISATTLSRFAFSISGVAMTLTDVQIERNDDSSGWIGNDIWGQVERLTIDFGKMTLSVKAKR